MLVMLTRMWEVKLKEGWCQANVVAFQHWPTSPSEVYVVDLCSVVEVSSLEEVVHDLMYDHGCHDHCHDSTSVQCYLE